MLFSLRIFGILGVIFGALMTGCGGGGSSTSTGKVLVHISWPGRARYIPPYANSIVCQLQVAQGAPYTLTVNRPSDQALDGVVAYPQQIPKGNHPLTITAYSESGGLGEVVATATTIASVQPGKPYQVDVSADLQSTIDRLVIEGQPLTVEVGRQLQLRGHAEDSTGKVLLLPANSLSWSVPSSTDAGSLNTATAVFTGSALGKILICLNETGANKQVTAEITVTEATNPSAVIVQVDWPGRGRYVPPYANSISCQLQGTAPGSSTLTINRTQDGAETSSVSFPDTFPAGQYVLTVNAYDHADAAGQVVATAAIAVTIQASVTKTINVTADLQSTIDHLVIEDQPLSAVMPTNLQLVGHAEDAKDNVILLPSGTLKWEVVTGSDHGTINASTGIFTPTTAGSASVRLSEVGAAKSVQADVLVKAPTSGSLTIAVDWPGRSRYVPPYANSLVSVITISPFEQYTLMINRTGDGATIGSGTFSQIFPAGTYTIKTTAYSQPLGVGTIVASATTSVTIRAGEASTQNVSADLDSPIDHLVIDGDPITAKAPIDLQITGHAEDASGKVILLPVGALTWDVGAGGAYGTIHSVTGVFSPYYPGTAYVRLREKGAGKSTQIKVTITVNVAARFYISDNGNNRLVRMTAITGTAWKAFTWKNTCACEHQVTVDNRNGVYWPCSDSKLHYIANYDTPVEVTLGDLGSGYGCFNNPKGVATDRLNRIYIADTGNNRIVRINDISGAGWTEVGRLGNGDGELNKPTGICVSPDFEVFVADSGNHRIVRFVDMAPSGWDMLGSYGSGLWQFNNPMGVTVFRTGLYITDTGNNRIVNVTDIRGTGWTTYGTYGAGTNQFSSPTGITCDLNGYFYVNDTGNYRAVRFTTMTGTNWLVYGTQGTGTNQFKYAYGICAK